MSNRISYKEEYLKLKKMIDTPIETKFICPECGSMILTMYNGEFYCSNSKCNFDKEDVSLWFSEYYKIDNPRYNKFLN